MFTKAKGQDGSTPTGADTIRPASAKPSARVVPSIIATDMEITGSVLSQGEMTIDGKIDGDVRADSLTIGPDGEIIGEISAKQVIVRGKVKGSIRANRVELEASAEVYGDIVHERLSIQNDAVFEGQVKHSKDPLKTAEAASETPKAQASTPSPAPAPSPSPSATSPSGGAAQSSSSASSTPSTPGTPKPASS